MPNVSKSKKTSFFRKITLKFSLGTGKGWLYIISVRKTMFLSVLDCGRMTDPYFESGRLIWR